MISPCIDLHGQTASEGFYHYVVVRGDLPIGVLAAMVGHAAGESAIPRPTPGCTMIVLRADGEDQLGEIGGRFSSAGIGYHLVVESDGKYAGQMMAIGLFPTQDREAVRKVTSDLPLVK